MRRDDWSPEDLIGCWTLVERDWPLVGNKSGATRLGFALLLKFFEVEGRFPLYPEEIPAAAVDYVASLVKVEPALFAKYAFAGRTIEYHRAQIRRALGFREATRPDEDALTGWLADEVCGIELLEDRLVQALLVRCRAERIEPPGRIDRIVASAQVRFEAGFCARTVDRLGAAATGRLAGMVAERASEPGLGVLAQLKADPDAVSLDAILTEIGRLLVQSPPAARGLTRR